jgi:endonuclease/exonuclease/phosphatase family metal-dependent hydrolase
VHKLLLPLIAALLAVPAASPSRVASAGPGLTIVTLNMAKETSADRILREWTAAPRLREADIFLLQEIKEQPGTQCIANRLGAALGLHVAYSGEAPGVADRGLAILSRFPLREVRTRALNHFDLRFHSRTRFALSATADTPWGPVRLDDVHLDTRLNARDRLAQLEPVVRDSARFAARRIVAGDFNSNPFYWIEHIVPLPALPSQAVAVEAFMKKQGFATAISESETTFDYLGMHLDWIWMAGLRSTESQVLPLDFSDHHAVWTRVEFE